MAAEGKPGVKSSSSIVPCFLFVEILVGELCAFFTKAEGTQERTIVTADCCYFNPLLRRIIRFLGVYTFGLFTTTIFANAGQVVTGNQTPHFLSACRPNYTALGCQSTMQYIAERRACTGNQLIVTSARKSFPSKDAALSVYSAVYTVGSATIGMPSTDSGRWGGGGGALGSICWKLLITQVGGKKTLRVNVKLNVAFRCILGPVAVAQ
ncbi:phospholipid phosphatase-related protein type 2a [Etheostoma cragini]|uniref:phospholipid phosphatase-related protein type 2a n=1 Tax=Etheostoma cragini TaxID=417921 RepID=UPI00155EC785|nr:phospholipid phosphatase-related protein type 2a [Etheostoma cragini]